MFIPKFSQNQYINTFNKDIYKRFRNKFQDPTRDLLDPKAEFVRWCPYSELDLNFCTKKFCNTNYESEHNTTALSDF